MAAFNLKIEGGFFIATDDPASTEWIRNPRDKTTFLFDDSTDIFQFFSNVVNPAGRANQADLGTYDFSDFGALEQDGVPVAIADARALATYLGGKLARGLQSVNLENEIVPKENTSTYKQLAQLNPASPNTKELLFSPDANQEVHIMTVSVVNFNNQDVTVKFYNDDDGTTWDNTTIIANPKIDKNEYAPSIFSRGAIILNNSAGSLAVESDDVDVTITLWGVIYDLS
jgi:hypothetical protein